MASRLLLPTAAELLKLSRAGVAEIRTHIDGTVTLSVSHPYTKTKGHNLEFSEQSARLKKRT